MSHKAAFDESRARTLRAFGRSWESIAEAMGCGVAAIRWRIDPEFRDREAERHSSRASHYPASTRAKADAAAFLATVPPDTRDLTARLMGDPLPSRSALSTQEGKGT